MAAGLSAAVMATGVAFSAIVDKGMKHALKRPPGGKLFMMAVLLCTLLLPVLSVMADLSGGIWSGLFWGSLAAAVYSDHCCTEVYDFMYLPAVAASIILFVKSPAPMAGILEFLFFCLCQAVIFRRLYGASDCIAYCVCAAWIGVLGGGLFEDVLVMVVSFTVFVMAQVMTGNIDEHLKLTVPKAYIPSIGFGMAAYQCIRSFLYMGMRIGFA